MTDEEQIRQVLYDFVDGGLVSMDIDKALGCIADHIIGIGIGDQGLVRSRADVESVFFNERRDQDKAVYSLTYNQLEILVQDGKSANLCADISIFKEEKGETSKSHLLQSLVLTKQDGTWKICGLHASVPAFTMENVSAYPLKYAEKLLQDLRTEIGEEAYLAEEQYRLAVLSDTVAFYIINFTRDCFEQSQINNGLCVYTEPGTPYGSFIRETLPNYVSQEHRAEFEEIFSLASIRKAIEEDEKELVYEYQFICPDGAKIWMVTVVRLITDCVTGEHKGIMYVKDINQQKLQEIEMRDKAERDVMTGLYNKAAFIECVKKHFLKFPGIPVLFLMLDVDNFKEINDTFGHPLGDKVLIETAGMIKDCFEKGSIIGRLGGDEFGVFTPVGTTQKRLEECTEELFLRIRKMQITSDTTMRITCSVGFTVCRGEKDILKAYERADKALYHSKRNGRNRFSYYEY